MFYLTLSNTNEHAITTTLLCGEIISICISNPNLNLFLALLAEFEAVLDFHLSTRIDLDVAVQNSPDWGDSLKIYSARKI
jgi:hypothetical protein